MKKSRTLRNIEFTGSAAKKPRKLRKPPPRWIVGWLGGVLLFVGGGALGGFTAVSLFWWTINASDDPGSPLMAVLFWFLSLVIGAVAGSGAGLVIWSLLRARARELEESD